MTSHSQLRIPSHQSLIPAFKLLAAASPQICMGAKHLFLLGLPLEGKVASGASRIGF